MASTLKGDGDMLKLFERYFKIKEELSVIEARVKHLGFKSVEECAVLFSIAETPKGVTTKEIVNDNGRIFGMSLYMIQPQDQKEISWNWLLSEFDKQKIFNLEPLKNFD